MNNPRPICVVYFPPDMDLGNGRPIDYGNAAMGLEEKFNHEYYVLAIPGDRYSERIELEVFFDSNIQEVDIAELRKIIEESVPKPSQYIEDQTLNSTFSRK